MPAELYGVLAPVALGAIAPVPLYVAAWRAHRAHRAREGREPLSTIFASSDAERDPLTDGGALPRAAVQGPVVAAPRGARQDRRSDGVAGGRAVAQVPAWPTVDEVLATWDRRTGAPLERPARSVSC